MAMDIIEKARMYRAKIEQNATLLDDESAVAYPDLYPMWSPDNREYKVGDRVRYNEILYKVLQDHYSRVTWEPDVAPSLFARVLIPDPEVIPVWEQPSAENAYMTGDRVHYPGADDPVYRSLIDNNVWSPEAYPAGWMME